MKVTAVRYRTKPEQADENARLIGQVFEELRAKAPQDVRYLSLRLADGTFVHSRSTLIPTARAMRGLSTAARRRAP